MRWLRLTLFILGGMAVMAVCLFWVSRFFGGGGDVTPVIWLEKSGDEEFRFEESRPRE